MTTVAARADELLDLGVIQPRVSLVTPSFNQGCFIRETIDSVLAQSYPAIDYLIVDAGSTDNTCEILRSYGDRIRWISEPDRGQADALVKGFAQTRGEILGWLDADDTLMPRAVATAVQALNDNPDAGLVYGEGMLIDGHGGGRTKCPWVGSFDLHRLVYLGDDILQPAAFFRRASYERVGGLDVTLRYAMDWDLWIKLARLEQVVYIREVLCCVRLWGGTKTSTGGWPRIQELSRVALRHTGRRWTPAVQRTVLYFVGSLARGHLPRSAFAGVAALGRWLDRRIVGMQLNGSP